MTDWLAETRFVLRGFRRTPSFAITIVATLILGLGPVAAVFAFADGYLFRPLPFPDADRVYVVDAPGAGLLQTDTDLLRHSNVSELGFVEWTVGRRVRGFGLLIDNRRVDFYLEGVCPAFRKTLAIPIVAGRDFTDDDHRPADPAPIWLTHSFWVREFGGDPSILGRTFAADSPPQRVTVVGILGPRVSSFDGANEPPAGVSPELSGPPDPRRGSSPIVRLPLRSHHPHDGLK
jgi:hypothetical protein